MSWGMSYNEYWHGKPILAKYYWEKHKIDIEQRNQELWLQGLYIYDALAVVMANSFSKNSKQKYLDKPIDLFPKTEEQKEDEKQKIRQALYEKLNAWKAAFEKAQNAQKQNGDT